MNKLIKAGVRRTQKNLLFPILVIISVAAGVYSGITFNEFSYIDDMGILVLFFSLAVFISLSVGSEYSDGIMRNKIVSGHTKGQIILSELILSIGLGFLTITLYIVSLAVISHSKLGNVPSLQLFLITVGCFIIFAFITTLLTVTACLIPSKAIGAVACILLILVLYVAYDSLNSLLSQPQNIEIDYFDENDDYVRTEIVPNKRYIDGFWRKVCEFFNNAIPFSHISEYENRIYIYNTLTPPEIEAEIGSYSNQMLYIYPACSAALAFTVALAGFLVFRKKDLK